MGINVEKKIQLAFDNLQKRNFQQTEYFCKQVLKIQPNNANAVYFLGIIYYQLGNFDNALQYFQKLIKINPNFADAYCNIGSVFLQKGKLSDAIQYYQKAFQINPNSSETVCYLGVAFQNEGQFEEAISCYQRALKLNPHLADAYYNLGTIFSQQKEQLDEAIQYYQKAIELDPNFAEAYTNLGASLRKKGHLDKDTIQCYRKAIEIKPDLAEAYSLLTNQLQDLCDWQELKIMTAKLDNLTRNALNNGKKPAESPFHSVIKHDNLSYHFAIAKAWSNNISRIMSNLDIHFLFESRKTIKRKKVVGYISNNFRNHPMAHLTCSLFGLHNRDEFEIYCYSYGKDDGSYYRKRIKNDCDKFIDISSFDYEVAANLIYKDQVDILVDFNGYTQDNRIAICALRPAPIQVRYLGLPCTTGADFFDYIITDKIVTPEDHKPYYSEKFVYMPHCYQVNDHAQPISAKNFKREDFGLPKDCFIFCSFNNPYKIDPIMFDIWMRILKQVPESVLWLIFGSKLAEDNLKREAEARGVDGEKLIFAKKLPKDEHLSRLRLADLALDTRIVNGHITTSDALWAGVPVITLQGNHFASRAASSILSALGVSDLITYSLEEYESLAVRLAHNAVALKEIRQRIAQNRTVEPLFDTPRFVRNLEIAYRKMWEIFLAGEAPRHIEILES